MKKEQDLTIPPGLDLGDLANVKVGDEVVMVTFENGVADVSNRVRRVRKIEDWRTLTETSEGGPGGGWQHKFKGACARMYGLPYFYSANPAHLEEAKRKAIETKNRMGKRKLKFQRRMELAKEAGEILGDGWQDRMDDGYHSSAVAQGLVERLTDEQIATLTGWLKGIEHSQST
jgi:hypothetical protein